MASGREHLKIWGTATAFLALPGSIAYLAIPTVFDTEPWWEAQHLINFSVGWLIAPAVNPDKDVEGTTFEEAWLVKWMPPLGLMWQLVWYPYAKGVKHRAPESHGFIQGTVLRFLYMLGVVLSLIWGWSLLAHVLLLLDGFVSALPGFPRGVIASPQLWLWPWPLEVTIMLAKWMAGRPFEIMWYLIGQECATVISHLLPDRLGFWRTSLIFGD